MPPEQIFQRHDRLGGPACKIGSYKPQTSLMVIVTRIFQNPVADQENIGSMDNFLFVTTFLLRRNKLLSPLWISKK